MEKNIIELLNSNLRVIIPELGAFIIRQKEPRIVVFNEFLKYNDGLLIDYIVKTEGIDREVAQQRVSDFAEDALKLLESGKNYIINGLGELQKDNSGKITFTAEIDVHAKESSESGKAGAILSLDEEVVQTPESTIQPVIKQVVEEKPKIKAKTRTKAKTKTETKASVPEREVEIVKEKSPIITENTKKESILPEPDKQKLVEIKAPVFTAKAPVFKAEVKKPSGNLTNKVLIWVFLFLFANAVVLLWFIYREDIKGIFNRKNVPAMVSDSVAERLTDSILAAVADTTEAYLETLESSDVNESNSQQEGMQFYIVAGCFRNEINADELVVSLKSEGFKAEKFGKIGNLFAVSFASFDDKELAVKELKRIREELYPDAWMTRF